MKLTGRQSSAVVVAVLMTLVTVQYCYLIIIGEIAPILATWSLFFVAVSLGLWTYFQADKETRDPITNIANVVDVFVVTSILVCLVFLGKNVRHGFNVFEVFCFVFAGAILVYYLIRRNAKVANIAVNVLLVVGYLPTIVHLWTADRNTESFLVWAAVWLASATACYNPIKERDFLAFIYAARALVLSSIVLTLMTRLEL